MAPAWEAAWVFEAGWVSWFTGRLVGVERAVGCAVLVATGLPGVSELGRMAVGMSAGAILVGEAEAEICGVI